MARKPASKVSGLHEGDQILVKAVIKKVWPADPHGSIKVSVMIAGTGHIETMSMEYLGDPSLEQA